MADEEESAAAPAEETTEEPAPEAGEEVEADAAPAEAPAEAAEAPVEGETPTETEDKDPEKAQGSPKKSEVKPLFDSKGSLLDTQSFVKGKLDELKNKRAAVATLVEELQGKVKAYKMKENPTEEDIANLKKYHGEFLQRLGEYEEMTRNLEKLMGMEDVSPSKLDLRMSAPTALKRDKPHTPDKPKRLSAVEPLSVEEKLPKLIVCGTDMGDNVPRIIVCEPLRKKDLEPFGGEGSDVKPGDCMNKLNECYSIQQKLAAENAEVEKIRYQQQQKLLEMQDIMDQMKQRMKVLEMDNLRIQAENQQLQQHIRQPPMQGPMSHMGQGGPKMCKRELYTQYRGGPAEGMGQIGSQPPPQMQDLVCRCKRRQ